MTTALLLLQAASIMLAYCFGQRRLTRRLETLRREWRDAAETIAQRGIVLDDQHSLGFASAMRRCERELV